MSDDNTNNTTPPANTDTGKVTPEEVPADVLRRMLDETRQEAAAARVKGKQKVEETKAAVTQEFEAKLASATTAHEATKVDLAKTKIEVDKLTVAIDAGVPTDQIKAFAKLLQGATVEELKAHAEEVKGLFNFKTEKKPAVDPTAGSGGAVLPLNGDKLLGALDAIVNKR